MAVNVPKLKQQMRTYAVKHGVRTPRGINYASKAWGAPARVLAWRVSKKKTGKGATGKQKVWEMFNPPSFVNRFIRALVAELGVKEFPPNSNSGPRVRTYQAVTGAYNQPWCASFVAWGLTQAGLPRAALPALAAYVPAYAATNNKHIKTVALRSAKRGDLLCLFGDGHIEAVTKVLIPGLVFRTIGGNTSPDSGGSQSNGGMVCRRTRYGRDVSAAKRVRP